MKPETADCLTKARECLDGAKQIAGLPLPQVAAREAYLAAFHAAEAYIFEQTGREPLHAARVAGGGATVVALGQFLQRSALRAASVGLYRLGLRG